ncbi:hypothetical protein QO012_001776 [Methylobacterium aerolatum]|uniref:Uncharacterized protein n=1 Tax=Methylobacterium aerolatum TaxID=418708 RepID=A0ABU0I046_9HYPH|nr:hypothetical protein [Methylobacterium aerolatum]GJD36946.1 hypothetical protein FMGBMHLM_3871 [Methylobacterium aerolatum]
MPSLERFYPEGYVARLHRRGYETIGRGGMDALRNDASLLFAKPSAGVVVKVGLEPYADPRPRYAAWCFRHPGPFMLSVRSLMWHGDAGGMGLSRDAGRESHTGHQCDVPTSALHIMLSDFGVRGEASGPSD